MSEYIRFDLLVEKPKTNVYTITNIKTETIIGVIKWHGAWRQYCLFPTKRTVWHPPCLQEVIKFIKKLMEDRSAKKEGKLTTQN